MRPPISYYGGKQAIIRELLPMIPPHEVYSEVFFGGGTMFWTKKPAPNETINDRLDSVVNFYRVLKTRFKELQRLINASLISRTVHREALALVRQRPDADPVRSAWAFWYTTNFSFANKIGGGYKYSNQMNNSVPATLAVKKREFTERLVARLEAAYIENEDALKILRSRNDPRAFHYLDPPYMNADQGHYKGYSEQDFEGLLGWCATECRGKFLLSNYPSEVLSEYTNRYGWHTAHIDHSSKHGAHVRHRKKDEIVVWNYTAPAHTQLSLF